jgi:hypothetical protein
MESRRHSGTIPSDQSAGLEELVFELVRERLLKAVGAGGMWTLQFRASTDTDSLFGETISEYIARDIANHLAAPAEAVDGAHASVELAETDVDDAAQNADDDAVIVGSGVESTEWIIATVPAEIVAAPVLEVAVAAVEHDVYDEHRMFKPRKAA